MLSVEWQPIEYLIELGLGHLARVCGVIRNDFISHEKYWDYLYMDPMIAVIDTHSFSM